MKKNLIVLGSTGSIGRQTLEVCDQFADLLQPVVLTAGQDWQTLAAQCRKYHPALIAIADDTAYPALKAALTDCPVEILAGADGVAAAAAYAGGDLAVAAISGVAGLRPVLAAIAAGKDLALANKEALVAAGDLVMRQAAQQGIRLLPVDSEHSALWQCLQGERPESIAKLVLTASGGPFRQFSAQQLAEVTPQMALQHPNWRMGAKITVDCATMVNKGLEMIEAHHLYQIPYDKIEAVLHPESIIHSLVEFVDGSSKAQLARPDMRLPIQYALLYPERRPGLTPGLPLWQAGALHFEQVDAKRFPGVSLAVNAAQMGGAAPVVFNAANEALVALFLQEKIPFSAISRGLAEVLAACPDGEAADLEQIVHWHHWAQTWVQRRESYFNRIDRYSDILSLGYQS